MSSPKKQHPIELHALVRGQVQGVGFRATTRSLATQLGLRGTVRNCSDGSVEIVAQGPRDQVDALLVQLKNTFGPNVIQSVECHYPSPRYLQDAFNIIA